MIVRFGGKRIVYSTGEKILPTKWGAKEKRAVSNRSFLEGGQINDELERCRQKCKEAFRNIKYQQIELTKENLKAELDKLIRGYVPQEKEDFY